MHPGIAETARIFVARREITPNTPIDNVPDYFEVVNYPADLIRDAIQEKDRGKLHLRVVCHYVPQGFPVTAGHLRLPGELGKPELAVSWLGIQESVKPPKYYKFINGRSATPPDTESAHAGPEPERAPAPATPKRDE